MNVDTARHARRSLERAKTVSSTGLDFPDVRMSAALLRSVQSWGYPAPDYRPLAKMQPAEIDRFMTDLVHQTAAVTAVDLVRDTVVQIAANQLDRELSLVVDDVWGVVLAGFNEQLAIFTEHYHADEWAPWVVADVDMRRVIDQGLGEDYKAAKDAAAGMDRAVYFTYGILGYEPDERNAWTDHAIRTDGFTDDHRSWLSYFGDSSQHPRYRCIPQDDSGGVWDFNDVPDFSLYPYILGAGREISFPESHDEYVDRLDALEGR